MTGIQEIDKRHAELFIRVRGLIDACGDGKGRDEVGRFQGYIVDYVTTLFPDEERCMTEYEYDDRVAHRLEHEQFKSEVAWLRNRIRVEGSGTAVVLETVRLSVEWIAYHMNETDRRLALFLRNKTMSRELLKYRGGNSVARIDA